MTTRKKALALLLATLQVAWSFSWGAYEAVAQVVNSASAQVHTGGVPVIPASAVGAFSPVGRTMALPQASLSASFVTGLSPVPVLTPSAALAPSAVTPSAMQAAPALQAARPAPARASASALSRPVAAAPAIQAAAALSAASKDGVAASVRRDAPSEDSSRAGAESFAALYPEALIETGKGALAGPVRALPGTARRSVLRSASVAAAKNDAPLPVAAVAAKAPTAVPAPTFWSKPAVRVAIGAASAVAIAAALPLLSPHVAVVAAAGSVALSVIGLPQIWKNYKGGKDSVKDLAIASPLIWFAAATLLSVVSIGSGASLWWNLANVAGVIESGVVVGQINWHKRDRKELKATALTALAVLAPLPLIAGAIFMPLSAWLTASFTAAMGLLWVLNWPQIRRNFKIFEKEGRAPQGIAPMYPALVVAGSLLHLYAAVMGGDIRWAVNAAIGILTATIVLSQIYGPKAANSLIGPLVRLVDRLMPDKTAASANDAALKAKAKALISPLLTAGLTRHAATDGGRAMAKALEAARALPGRSVVFLEAPTAAGKSTLAEGLKTTLGSRIKVFPVDRYFKPKAEVPLGPDGEPDFDRPDSLYLDRVAADIKTMLAGGRVELPLNDMAAQTTRFDSGEYLTLGADEVLIVDSIYASHDKLIKAAEGAATLNVYLDAPAVIRLARRLRRDRLERGISAETNLKRWPVILQNESEFILPLKRRADYIVNLIGDREIVQLSETYGDVLAAEWAARGEDPALTARFLEGIRSSLLADQNSRPMRILITGPPGSGKTTFGKRMARDYGMIHISVGELLRAKAAADPALAAEMAKGELVDSALVRGVVLERLSRPDVLAAGFVLDGFPRRPEEIGVIESWMKDGNAIDALVNLKTPVAELQRRIAARGRMDDSPEVFARRMEIYREETAPVLEHFRKTVRVLETDAAGPDAEANYAGVRALVDQVKND
ncbi:MAG: nucleoside monophosphate kinase [Elusimicrobiota bacterium]|nr:nucleoside monophosphate kinase [Elusimicrobiota bacterium]